MARNSRSHIEPPNLWERALRTVRSTIRHQVAPAIRHQVAPALRPLFLLVALAASAGLSGCLSSTLDADLLNGRTTASSDTDTGSDDDSNTGGNTSGSVPTPEQCTLYDESNPVRGFCTECYDTLVAAGCPGKDTIEECVDTAFVRDFPARLNLCIDATIVSGFTCTRTCSGGQVLDEASCRCVAASTSATGSSSLDLIDRGQIDLGPPVVGATFPENAAQRVIYDGDAAEGGGAANGEVTACPLGSDATSSSPFLYLSVRNRGGTRVQDNVMTATRSSSATTNSDFLTMTVSPPATLLTSPSIGINAGANLAVSTRGTNAFEDATRGSYGGAPGGIRRISGTPEPAPFPTPSPSVSNGTLTHNATWSYPGYTARDEDGNIYVSDTKAGKVFVICYVDDDDWCNGNTVGSVHLVAGGGSVNYNDTTANVVRTAASLNLPMGIAVDAHKNVFIADHGNQAIAVVCAGTSGVCSRGGASANRIYAIAGTIIIGPFNNDPELDQDIDYPIAFDIETENDEINFYFSRSITRLSLQGASAGDSDSIRRTCEFTSSQCSAGVRVDPISTAALITDVKLNTHGNLYWVEPLNRRIRAKCMDLNQGDPCGSYTATGTRTLNDSSLTTDSGDGGDIADAGFILPYRLVVSKKYADDYTVSTFTDNNLVVVSALSQLSDFNDGRRAGGNTVRILCGQSAPTAGGITGSMGYCEDLTPGTVHTLAGQSGRAGMGTASSSSPKSVAFGALTGATYDRFKNIVISSAHDTTLFGNDDDLPDTDQDGTPDNTDPDADNDGITDNVNGALFDTECPTNPDTDTRPDQDNDNRCDGGHEPNLKDTAPTGDHDFDGTLNSIDTYCILHLLYHEADTDDDGDGIPDAIDEYPIDHAISDPIPTDPDRRKDVDRNNNDIYDATESPVYSDTDDYNFPYFYDNSLYVLHLMRQSTDFKVRYNFTDSNNFTSRYCLQMRVRTACGYVPKTPSATEQSVYCTCNVGGPAGASSTDTSGFWQGIARDSDCF